MDTQRVAAEVELRLSVKMTEHQSDMLRRFDRLETVLNRAYFGIVASLASLIAFGIEHFLGKYIG